MSELKRCTWCGDSRLYVDYHDREWGSPVHNDRDLFECLCLENMQAGLSFFMILKKRMGYKESFDNFDIDKVALYNEEKVRELMTNDKIIRHNQKIKAIINNAKSFLNIQSKYGSFDKFIWQYVDNEPIINSTLDKRYSDVIALSKKISQDLRQYGFKFVGNTIVHAFMQAIGVINDHSYECFLHKK